MEASIASTSATLTLVMPSDTIVSGFRIVTNPSVSSLPTYGEPSGNMYTITYSSIIPGQLYNVTVYAQSGDAESGPVTTSFLSS